MSGRAWGGGAHVGQLVLIQPADFGRVGGCWMAGRLKDGDLAMVIRHAGDGYYTYKLVNFGATAGDGRYRGRCLYQLIDASAFGAYELGTPYAYQPTERETHLLLAGESIALDARDAETGSMRRVCSCVK